MNGKRDNILHTILLGIAFGILGGLVYWVYSKDSSITVKRNTGNLLIDNTPVSIVDYSNKKEEISHFEALPCSGDSEYQFPSLETGGNYRSR